MKKRVAFFGRGRVGLDVLKGLVANHGVDVRMIVVCGHSPEVGATETDFEEIAKCAAIPFFQSNTLNTTEWIERIKANEVELGVAMLWVNTIAGSVIAAVPMGIVNVHASLLPRYRGNACQTWAILQGETEVGLTVHMMEGDRIDSGPILLQERVPIANDTHVGPLISELQEKAAPLVLRAVDMLVTGTAKATAQDESQALYCFPRLPRDGEIDWNEPASRVETLVRAAGAPYPGAYSYFTDPRAAGVISKLTIDEAHVEQYPGDFLAQTGHLIRLPDGRRAVVCGDKQLLVLDQIRVDDIVVEPTQALKSVRLRLGLDYSNQLVEMEKRLASIEAQLRSNDPTTRFLNETAPTLELYFQALEESIDSAVRVLADAGIGAAANPLRNQSFQKAYFAWEQRERWFGVQTYRSLRLTEFEAEPFAFGLWFFSDIDKPVELRLYFSTKEEHASQFNGQLRIVFDSAVPGGEKVFIPADRPLGGYVVLPPDEAVRASQHLVSLARAFAESFR